MLPRASEAALLTAILSARAPLAFQIRRRSLIDIRKVYSSILLITLLFLATSTFTF